MADQDMQRTADEMERDLEEVSGNIDEAREKAPQARIDKDADLGGAAGDVSEEEPDRPIGDDPTGAVDDEHAAP